MTVRIHSLLMGTAAALLAAEPAALPEGAVVEDWPHFLGPHLNATTREGPLLEKWPATGPAIVWEAERGEGYSCPVIAGGRLFHFHRIDGKETLECREPATGKPLWTYSYAVTYQDRYGFGAGPRSSPVVDDGRVYIAGVTARLHCLSADKGELIWQRQNVQILGREHPSTKMRTHGRRPARQHQSPGAVLHAPIERELRCPAERAARGCERDRHSSCDWGE